MIANGLLDTAFIRSMITADDRWCASHGSRDGSPSLGAGILYYGIVYASKAKTCVCLGSGGGFVPRLMRQAQRDLKLQAAQTILVDGARDLLIHHQLSLRGAHGEKLFAAFPLSRKAILSLRRSHLGVRITKKIDLCFRNRLIFYLESFFCPGRRAILPAVLANDFKVFFCHFLDSD